MSLWIANKGRDNEYIFTEMTWPKGQESEDVLVGPEKYYRNIIKYPDNTFYIYTAKRLKDKELKELEKEWNRFCPK